MPRLVIVSNRLPISIARRKGVLNTTRSTGGLATGLGSMYKSYESLWIGWPGLYTSSAAEKEEIEKTLAAEKMLPVFLSKRDIELYYEGFSNKTVWPLFHYFPQDTRFENSFWDAYLKVNRLFCDIIAENAQKGDLIWIHDYHLMVLPSLVRARIPEASTGYFLHIPFPSFEIFRALPWREEILNGLLGADLVGFHTFDYARHFLSAVARILGFEATWNKIPHNERITRVDCFPMGIDFDKFHKAPLSRDVKREIRRFTNQVGEVKIILSIDRLDYSKGILQRLHAFHRFLHENPEYREKIILLLIVVPSRSRVETYLRLKHQVDEQVGRINGEHGTIGWSPIWYLYRSLSFNSLSAIYSIADVCLVTPFRDGMNLIAKEYIATQRDGKGVLILSEMAGAADELGEAIAINPNDINGIVVALKKALSVPAEEQIKNNHEMQNKLKRYNVKRWAEDFIDRLLQTKKMQADMYVRQVDEKTRVRILKKFRTASSRLIFLDYDGTLVPFSKTPMQAKPNEEIDTLLKKLSNLKNTEIVLISGRGKDNIDKWFGSFPIHLVAEHGAWLRRRGSEWETLEPLSQEWKEEIYPLLQLYVDRTPGSIIEEKEFSLVWHYRKADVGLGQLRARELAETLVYLTGNLNLQVLEGSKVIEVKNSNINKGRAALTWLAQSQSPFLLAVGDDWTDEDLFRAMPEHAFTIKVGFATTLARHNMKSYIEVRTLLKELISGSANEKTE